MASAIRFDVSSKPQVYQFNKRLRPELEIVGRVIGITIERSNAWVERCKSLVKNFDRTLARVNAKLKLCFI